MRTLASSLLLLTLLTLLAGCSGGGEAVIDEASRFVEMTQDIQIDDNAGVTIDEALDHYDVDGATVVVIEDGVPVLLRGHYGYQDPDAGIETDEHTIYPAASLTKLIVGLGMAKASRLGTGPKLARKARRTADDHPGSIVQQWTDAQPLRGTPFDPTEKISIRRLLQNAAATNRPKTGLECSRPSATTGLDDLLTPSTCTGCLAVNGSPGTAYGYSSGGFALAEAMLLAETGRSAEEFLTTEVLDPLGMTRSTFADASASMDDLARCGQECACEVAYADVKFPGGLIAHPEEYATLLRTILDDGYDAEGTEVLDLEDIHEVLKPAQHINSSKRPCASDSQCMVLPAFDEVCHSSACIRPLETGAGEWYGLGVHLSPDDEVDGFSRTLFHRGGQDGVATYFNIDRELGNGIVVMMNGGSADDRKALRSDIIQAFKRHYR